MRNYNLAVAASDNYSLDKWPHLPTNFKATAKMIEDGEVILIVLPQIFVGHRLNFAGEPTKRAFYIESSNQYGVSVTEYPGNLGQLRLPASIVPCTMKKVAESEWNCTRKGSKIHIGNLIEYMAMEKIPTSPRPITRITAYEQTRRADALAAAPTAKPAPELTPFAKLKSHVSAINELVASGDIKLRVKEDGTLGATFIQEV